MKIRIKQGVTPEAVEKLAKNVGRGGEQPIPPEINPTAYSLFDWATVLSGAKAIIRERSVNGLLEATGFDWTQRGVSEMVVSDAESSLQLLDGILTSGKPFVRGILLPMFARKEASIYAKKQADLPKQADARVRGVAKEIRQRIRGTASDAEMAQYESLVQAYTKLYEAG